MKVRLKLAHKRLTNRIVFLIFLNIAMFCTRIILWDSEVDCEFKAFQGNMFMDRLAALMALAQHGNIHRVSQNAQNSTKMQTITVFLMVPHTYMLTSCKLYCNTMWQVNWYFTQLSNQLEVICLSFRCDDNWTRNIIDKASFEMNLCLLFWKVKVKSRSCNAVLT